MRIACKIKIPTLNTAVSYFILSQLIIWILSCSCRHAEVIDEKFPKRKNLLSVPNSQNRTIIYFTTILIIYIFLTDYTIFQYCSTSNCKCKKNCECKLPCGGVVLKNKK